MTSTLTTRLNASLMVVRLAHSANDLIEAPPETTAPVRPSVCFDSVGRNSPGCQFAPNHLAADADFFRNVGEGTSLLAQADDCRDFVVEQCHAPRILCFSQLATMFRPTRIVGHVGFLRYRQFGALLLAHRLPLAGLSLDPDIGHHHWTSRCPGCSPTLCQLRHPRVRSPGAGQGGSGGALRTAVVRE